jgi:hypothetical protein
VRIPQWLRLLLQPQCKSNNRDSTVSPNCLVWACPITRGWVVALSVSAAHAMTPGVPQFNTKSELIDKLLHQSSTHHTNTTETHSKHKQEIRVSFISSLLHGRVRYTRFYFGPNRTSTRRTLRDRDRQTCLKVPM